MKSIKIYTSREKQLDNEIEYVNSISPVQRLKETVELIKKVYGNKTSLKRITIIRKG